MKDIRTFERIAVEELEMDQAFEASGEDRNAAEEEKARPTSSDAGTKLVGPRDGRSLRDWLYPELHARWWFRDVTLEELAGRLAASAVTSDDKDAASMETLEHARDAARGAADRAEAAERRAAALGGAVAIATTLTISGSALAIDHAKVPQQGWRIAFAVLLVLATVAFAYAAFSALRTIVKLRRWAHPNPRRVEKWSGESLYRRRSLRGAEALKDFAFNWEIADVKLRSLDTAFAATFAALVVLVSLATTFLLYAILS